MGTWGHNFFENDAAFDYMADIEESDNPKTLMEEILASALEAEYLESDEAEGVIVVAIYIDRQQNGTLYSDPDSDEPLDVDTFPDRHSNLDLRSLKQDAIIALRKVLDENSELFELWSENEELQPLWEQKIKDLVARLEMDSL